MGRRSRDRIQGQKPTHVVLDELTAKTPPRPSGLIMGHDPANPNSSILAEVKGFEFTSDTVKRAVDRLRQESRYTFSGVPQVESTPQFGPEQVKAMMEQLSDRQPLPDYLSVPPLPDWQQRAMDRIYSGRVLSPEALARSQGLSAGITGSAYGMAQQPLSPEEVERRRQVRDLFGRSVDADEAELRRARRQRKARASAKYLEGVHDRLASKGKPAPQELIDAIEMMSQIAEGKLTDASRR